MLAYARVAAVIAGNAQAAAVELRGTNKQNSLPDVMQRYQHPTSMLAPLQCVSAGLHLRILLQLISCHPLGLSLLAAGWGVYCGR
jgi:hypothetical protein